MTKYCITSCIETERKNLETGEIIKKTIIQYFDQNAPAKSKNELGFIPIDRRIDEDGFCLSDFKKLPAYYDFKFSQVPGYKGKPISKLKKIALVENQGISFKRHEQDPDAHILIGGQYFDYSEGGKRLILSKIFAIDPNFEETDTCKGNPIVCYNYYDHSLNDFPHFPAYYLLDLVEERGKGGSSSVRLKDVEYLGNIKEEQSA